LTTTRARSGPRTLVAIAAALGLLVALTLPALAGTDFATVTGYAEGTPANNSPDTWGDDCEGVPAPDGGFGDTYELPALADGLVYSLVVVKTGSEQSNPGFVNTLFADPLAGQTVWADSNGNGAFDGDDKGISHIIVCTAAADDEDTPSPSPTEDEEEEEETPTPSPTERQGQLGGNPTPTPGGGSLPDTAVGGMDQVPAIVLSLIMLAALAGTAYARLARQR
jgi:hypothetical protein